MGQSGDGVVCIVSQLKVFIVFVSRFKLRHCLIIIERDYQVYDLVYKERNII